ncbi:DivIVA domain-containing protein [Micromonospora sp. KC207]|uniref:DivIVA domain-containing protein n=1 Tax=Micromonospora sp. KC207 TaxID=2530377 RepID=UPI0010458590|nr:DivIVA domain-containing protein [Micromonospora sp. KC207]TDC66775.1 DivIVA domain-containing protein [Micromonospora sp. KC207]
MGQVLLMLVVALTVAAVVFGVTVLVTGRDPGLAPVEPDGQAVPLPGSRPLRESDVGAVRFDTALRGYRMSQVDQVLRRAAYDIGYKSELIGVLEAEVTALREGRIADADALRHTREQAAAAAEGAATATATATVTEVTVAATGADLTVTAADPGPAGWAGDASAPGTARDTVGTAVAAAPEPGDREPTDPADGRRVGSEPA